MVKKPCLMKAFFTFLLCLFFAAIAHAQALRIDSTCFYCNSNPITFSEITDIIQTKDKGFAFVGRAGKPGGGILPPCPGAGTNPVMGKLDSLGNVKWIKNWCDTPVRASTICQTADGGYAINGGSYSASTMSIFRYDAQGNYLWRRDYGWNAGCGTDQIIPTPDNGFMLLGHARDRDSDILVTYDYPPRAFPTIDWILMKLDSSGNKQWVRTLGTSGEEESSRVLCDGKNYYLVGSTFSKDYDCADVAGHPGFAIYTIKLDSAGNVLWSKAHGAGFVSDVLFDERDNSILVTGRTNGGAFQEFSGLPVYGYDDIFLMKLDTAGNYKWGNIFGTNGVDEGHHICLAPNGGYFVAGEINNNATASGILLSVDSNGNQADLNIVNAGRGGVIFRRVFPSQNSYVVFGTTSTANTFSQGVGYNCPISSVVGSNAMSLSKLSIIDLSVNYPSISQSAFTLSPNPTRNSVEVRFEGQHSKGAITATNAEGKQMLRQQVRQDEQSIFLNTASWPPGTYLVCFQPEGKLSQCQKLLVQ